MRTCPDCLDAMKETRVGSLHLDFCKGCEGVWFDALELAAYTAKMSLPAPPDPELHPSPSASARRPCPACTRSELLPAKLRFLSVRGCPDCRGIFVPRHQMKVLHERYREELAKRGRLKSSLASGTADTLLSFFDVSSLIFWLFD